MLIAEVKIGPRGGLTLEPVPVDRFLVIDGKPVRYIDSEGTLRSVKPFVWGASRAEAAKMARGRL